MKLFETTHSNPLLKISFFSLLIVADQLSKHLISTTICNPYISWGIPLHGWILWLLIIISLILLFCIAKIYSFRPSLLLIIAGGIGNLIDRFQHGCVVDFISITLPFNLPFIGNTFPTFNLADIFITIGIIVFISQELFSKQKNRSYK